MSKVDEKAHEHIDPLSEIAEKVHPDKIIRVNVVNKVIPHGR